jgi:thiamine pyrophosphate-dependent acetolactate synthase large subunit-like protein
MNGRDAKWLGHADARQVYDLPDTNLLKLKRSMTATGFRVEDPEGLELAAPRQVIDLPRISMAKP